MTDDTDKPEPSADINAELARLAPKITKAAKAKSPKPAPTPTKPEFTLSAEIPSTITSEPPKFLPIDTIKMTAKDARAHATLKRTRKPDVPYSQEIANRILSLMHEGLMLVEILEMDDMPSMVSVWNWRQKFPDFDLKLTRAREALGDQFAWEVLRVSLDSTAETAACDRVKMDGFRWLAAKMYPKQYGDKTVQELTGTVVHETRHVIDATALNADQLEQLEGVLRSVQALPAPESKDE